MTVTEQTYLGGATAFPTVRHLTIAGTNCEIGRALASIAVERYGRTAERFRAPAVYARARRTFMQQAFPIHCDRMRGVADVLGVDPEDDGYDLTELPYHIDYPPASGCSVVYYPPSSTASGVGHLSRNYDFFIRSLPELIGITMADAAPPPAAAAPVMSEPYIMQWHPSDGGHASLAIHAFDKLGGTLDGINAAGLVVAIMADDEGLRLMGPHWEPHLSVQRAVGLHELACMRLLLDTCETAEQAKQALLTTKQYYRFVPCRYIVADRAGSSFVYETSTGRNVQHVIEGTAAPLVATNFQLPRHPEGEPVADGAVTLDNEMFWRYRVLQEQIAAAQAPFTVDDMTRINGCVNVERGIEAIAGDRENASTVAGTVGARTVWHGIYDQQACSLRVRFYLGEDNCDDGTHRERFSDYLTFSLNG